MTEQAEACQRQQQPLSKTRRRFGTYVDEQLLTDPQPHQQGRHQVQSMSQCLIRDRSGQSQPRNRHQVHDKKNRIRVARNARAFSPT